MAQTCAACHGAEGISAVGIFPNLAGQQASYLTKQILDIRDGKRVVPQMAGQVCTETGVPSRVMRLPLLYMSSCCR